MARNIKSYIHKATLVFQEEGHEDVVVEIVKGRISFMATVPTVGGVAEEGATPTEAAKRAFEAAVAIIEKRKEG